MKVRSGYKHQLCEAEEYRLPRWWPEYYKHDWSNDWVQLSQDVLRLKKGYCWNGANNYPDYDWIVVPSGVHDAMLQVFEYFRLTLSKDDQDELKYLIDRWFAELAQERAPKWRQWQIKAELFIGVNWLSRLLPGSQAEDHRIREYV